MIHTPPKILGKPLRLLRRIATCLLVTSLYFIRFLLYSCHAGVSVTNKDHGPGGHPSFTYYEDFALCNKTLYARDMPRSPPFEGNRTFGVKNWQRDMEKGIVLVNNTEGHRWVDGKRVQVFYGRTGNQIQEFFRAFDLARDRGGTLVIHDEGFPLAMTLQELYLGLNNMTEIEERFGVVFYDQLGGKEKQGLTGVYMEEAYHYISREEGYNLVDTMEHRQYAIQELYRMTAREMKADPYSPEAGAMCASLYALFGRDGRGASKEELRKVGILKEITKNYTVIHSRKLEGFETKFMDKAHEVFGIDNRAAVDLPVDMIKSILAPLQMHEKSVLVITDSQSLAPIQRLSTDPALGPHVQAIPKGISTLTGDIMLAILADVFIGNPVSTFSMYIAQARHALGIGKSYLFHRKNETSGEWETFCEDKSCLYHWMNVFVPLF